MFGRVLLCCVICLSVFGCNQVSNPGQWNQTQVEEYLKKKHNLVEIALLPKSEGGFTGSGKTKIGETYTFRVKQNAETKQLSWEFNSDRGDVGEQVYELVKPE